MSVFHTILIGDNGTPEADRAVDIAFSLAQCLHAKLVLVGVIAPPSPESQAEGVALEMPSAMRHRLQRRLEHFLEAGRERNIDIEMEIVDGNPEHEIERLAERHSADLIVVGHREISRLRRLLEGSTSESLVRRSHVSVLVVHEGPTHNK